MILVSFGAFVTDYHNQPLHISFNHVYLIEKLSVMCSLNLMNNLNSKSVSCKQLKEFTKCKKKKKTYNMKWNCTLTLHNYKLQKSKEMSRDLTKHVLWRKVSEWKIRKKELQSLPHKKRLCQLRIYGSDIREKWQCWNGSVGWKWWLNQTCVWIRLRKPDPFRLLPSNSCLLLVVIHAAKQKKKNY